MNLIQIIAIIIFLFTFALILSEKIHRTIAAMLGALIMLVAGIWLKFYSHKEAIYSIDFETLGLLMGMMIIVGLLQETGFFEYVAIITAKFSRGSSWLLLVYLGTTTTVLSLFLDNVTTIVLIAPVTLLIAELLGINPIPLLMAKVILANTGGVATLVGDPPNVIIASASGFSFNDFITHLMPVVFVCWIGVLFTLRFLFRKELAVRPKNIKALLSLDERKALKHPGNAKKILIVLGMVVLLFCIHGILHLTPDIIALGGAIMALLWIKPDMEKILHHIEWNVLLFFTGLFITVGGLKGAGIMELCSTKLLGLAQSNLLMADIIILWGSALATSLIGNIPFTISMVPIITGIGDSGVHPSSLWWALALGAGMGGNGTLIGSAANVLIVSLTEKIKKPISFKSWLKIGLPVMIAGCIISSIMFLLLFGWMQTP